MHIASIEIMCHVLECMDQILIWNAGARLSDQSFNF
eukprot:SAG11_NODE_24958_length_365_cov_1.319549_1_plen_35_part_01